MSALEELFWEAPVQALKQGYTFDRAGGRFICLLCGESFEQGQIYNRAGTLLDARKAVQGHLQDQHPPVPQYLLSLDKKVTGLSEIQKGLLTMLFAGLGDKEIGTAQGTSASTVRNHRFILRQKEKQAKVFLAIMELLRETTPDKKQEFIPVHRSATMVDERFAITGQEYEDILKAYFPEGPDGTLKSFPRKEKRKIAILRHIAGKFQTGRTYSEKEVNSLLKNIYADYVTLRRYLIEYGFLGREKNGSSYWVKN